VTDGFASFDLPAPIADVLGHAGFEVPLPVQRDALPPALRGRDVVVSAETGSGKTLAFVLPLAARLLAGTPGVLPRALILAPTRELAAQVRGVADSILRPLGLSTVLVTGGTPRGPQTRALSDGCDLIVATPGRLLDHARRGAFRTDHCRTVVLDEADRMLDLGFLPDARRCLDLLPIPRQTLLFSATIPKPVEELADELLDDPVRVRAEEDAERPVPPGIRHEATIVRAPMKRLLLVHLLQDEAIGSALVFVNSRFRCAALARVLNEEGTPADSLHAGRSQEDRDAALAAFRDGSLRVLIATDLAERGLDLRRLTHVINFDLPKQPERYAHRVGRTARAFGEGTAITMAAAPEKDDLAAIAETVGVEIPLVTYDGFDYAQRPEGLDPLIPREDLRRKDEERRQRAEELPKWKRGDARKQKSAFWERARDARKRQAPKNPNPGKRRRRRSP
jgi:ATP-dependent RNA helicase RhlE